MRFPDIRPWWTKVSRWVSEVPYWVIRWWEVPVLLTIIVLAVLWTIQTSRRHPAEPVPLPQQEQAVAPIDMDNFRELQLEGLSQVEHYNWLPYVALGFMLFVVVLIAWRSVGKKHWSAERLESEYAPGVQPIGDEPPPRSRGLGEEPSVELDPDDLEDNDDDSLDDFPM